jgi:hypothetical protein
VTRSGMRTRSQLVHVVSEQHRDEVQHGKPREYRHGHTGDCDGPFYLWPCSQPLSWRRRGTETVQRLRPVRYVKISRSARFLVRESFGKPRFCEPLSPSPPLPAGVGFVTAPSLNPVIMEFAAKQNIAVLPGALTPTEVVTAWSAGADFVKVFPCGPVGGDRYIKALHAALPQIPLIAAGGVNQQTAASFILSGATAIGVGTELIPTEAIQRRQSQRIHELARRFAKLVRDAREQIEAWERSQVVKEFKGTEKCEK